MNRKLRREDNFGASAAHARESFGKLKLNLEFLCMDNSYRCIMMSSAVSGEGKSTVAANLAVSLAASERKTLLVDTDLRHPMQHRLFDLVNKVGLSDIIYKNLDWHEYVNRTVTQNLSIITAGRMPPNPPELLGSNRMGNLVEEFKKEYDIILLDCSPILLVSDPISLLKHADGIIVVIKYNSTKIQDAIATRNALRLTNKPIIGTILNYVTQTGGPYDYGYHKTYANRFKLYTITDKPSEAGRQAGE